MSVSFGERAAVVSNPKNEKTLSATDVLAPTTMKNAAKCDTSCELRNPVSHQNFERILHFPRGVCLLECLFIPTSPCIWLLAPAAGLDSIELIASRWKWARSSDVVHAEHDSSSSTNEQLLEATRRHKTLVLSSLCVVRASEVHTKPDHPIGPPISQEYPLNLSI